MTRARCISSRDITAAILRYCKALELTGACRSVSCQLAQAAEYGCPIYGGGSISQPPQTMLVEAERPLRLCTRRERVVLVERYWNGGLVQIERRWGNRRETYTRPVWTPLHVVALRVGAPSVDAVQRCIARGRAKVKQMLACVR